MESSKNSPDIFKIIQGIGTALIITGIITVFAKFESFSERLIRIEERSENNLKNVNEIKGDLNEIKMEQKRCSDRTTQIEFKIGVLSESKGYTNK